MMAPSHPSDVITRDTEFVGRLAVYTDSLSEEEHSLFQDGSFDATLALATRCDAVRAKRGKSPQWPQLYTEAVNGLKSYLGLIRGAVAVRPEIASLAWGGLMFVIEMAYENALYFTKIGSILKLLGEDLSFYGSHADLIFRNWDLVYEALSDVYGDAITLCSTVYRTFTHKGGKKRTRFATTKTALNPFSTRFLLIYGDLHLRRQTIEPQLKVEELFLVPSRRSRRGTYTSSRGSYIYSAHSPNELGEYARTSSMTSSAGISHTPVEHSPRVQPPHSPMVGDRAEPSSHACGRRSTSNHARENDVTPTNSRTRTQSEARGRSPQPRSSRQRGKEMEKAAKEHEH